MEYTLYDIYPSERLVLNRLSSALGLVGAVSELAIERALAEGDGHHAVVLLSESPVGHTAACDMGNFAPPMDEHPFSPQLRQEQVWESSLT